MGRHPIPFVALMLLLHTAAMAADTPEASPEVVAAINKAVSKLGIRDDTPGVALWVYQPEELHFQKGYGLANLQTKQPIGTNTNFELASLSKTFTATAILILHDQGKLSIDDDFRLRLPQLAQFHPDRPVTIEQLLRHESGLPDYLELEDVPRRHPGFWDNDDYVAVFAARAKKLKFAFPPGAKYVYNNTNYFLLGSIVQQVSGKSFHRFVRDEIFEPLGMKHTFIYDSHQLAPAANGRARPVGYEWDRPQRKWQPTWGVPPDRTEDMLVVGDGSIWSSLEDLAQWDHATRKRRLLKPETWRRALTPHTTQDGETNGYGLGWGLYFDNPKKLNGFGHDGSWGGFNTLYYRHLGDDRSMIILSNRGNFDVDQLWEDVTEILND